MEIMVAKINDEYLSKYCEKCVVDKSGEDSLVLDGIWGIWGIWFRVCVAEQGGGVNFLSGGGDILFNFSFCPKLNKFNFVQKGFLGLL